MKKSTPQYVAPEAIGNNPNWSLRADIFSFGMLMLEIMSEHCPFNDWLDKRAIEDQIINETWKCHMLACLKNEVSQLIQLCCKKKPMDRPTISKVILAIENSCYSAIGLYPLGSNNVLEFLETGDFEICCFFAQLYRDEELLLQLVEAEYMPALEILCSMQCSPHIAYKLACVFDSNTSGKPKDEKRAAEWFQKAAMKGHASAQHKLAHMSKHGRGVTKSMKEAIHWYTKAAEQNYTLSQFNLGLLYAYDVMEKSEHKNLGLNADSCKDKAKEWFTKAAANGYKDAETQLKQLNKKT